MLVAIAVFLPLLSALGVGLFSRHISHRLAGLLSCTCMVITALVAWRIGHEVLVKQQVISVLLGEWLNVEALRIMWQLQADSLSTVMILLVTTVSAMVHLYSLGYMHEDPHLPRFMAYLSLFTFCMLMLVTATNFIQLFFGWEGVGLCSYLLVGFWYHKESANTAATKAFITNRVGDIGLLIGVALLYHLFHTLDFATLWPLLAENQSLYIHFLGIQWHAITLIGILLFIGCMGKSAQLGLHVWLPDAMEGPTPVSALIHAATMVTAGVFLVARCAPLYELAPLARDMITIIGGLTCLFAASIALVQNDIKRIIAYSTCSQLGYMFFACGVSAYSAGIFHLFTHGFFKALLFLGAGCVIHAMHHEQDIRKMGGLWKKTPITYACMWIGSLALAGIYPFAGFFSKDIILEAAYASGTPIGHFAFFCGIAAACMTAFYSWRLLILVFHGESRASKRIQSHAHDAPLSMLLPLSVLVIGAIATGWWGNHIGLVAPSASFWNGALVTASQTEILEAAHHVPIWVVWLPFIAGISGITLAVVFYILIPATAALLTAWLPWLHQLLLRKWLVDELYSMLLLQPLRCIAQFCAKIIDPRVIDAGGPGAMVVITRTLAGIVSRAQTGYLYHYAFVMIVVTMLALSLLLVRQFYPLSLPIFVSIHDHFAYS
jgi:NADH-quinone oxidoreductase subunit L